jgi:hypothetical protein
VEAWDDGVLLCPLPAGDGSAYLPSLRTLDPSDRRHESLLQQVDLADIAAACRARLG